MSNDYNIYKIFIFIVWKNAESSYFVILTLLQNKFKIQKYMSNFTFTYVIDRKIIIYKILKMMFDEQLFVIMRFKILQINLPWFQHVFLYTL